MSKKRLNIIPFQTEKNRYIYDGNSSEVVTSSYLIEYIIRKYYEMNKDEIYKSFNKNNDIDEAEFNYQYEFVSHQIENKMFYHDNKYKECHIESEAEAREFVYKAQASYLVLVLTGSCNMRCEYCVYSDKYPKEITYWEEDMSIETAKKAVDEYLLIHDQRVNRGFRKKPMIMFYGGEPLIKFELIKEIVEYVNKVAKQKASFYVTTNGLLLTEEVSRFLVENNFLITFSVDGYKENHDRNRVTAGGQTTFGKVMENIRTHQKIKQELDDKQMVTFNCCYDNYTDMIKCVESFEECYRLFDQAYFMFSPVSPYDTTYYEWTKERIEKDNLGLDEKTFNRTFLQLRERFFSQREEDKVFNSIALYLMFQPYILSIRSKWMSSAVHNACTPLTKMAVYPDGTYALCEKMNKRLPIGNVNTGVDYEAVCKVFNNFDDNFNKRKCSKCSLSNLCNVCYVYMDEKGQISEQYCETQRKQLISGLSDMYELGEKIPNFFKIYTAPSEFIQLITMNN